MTNKIEFKLYCPEVNKEIYFSDCQGACNNKLCAKSFLCPNRIESIKNNFDII